MSRGLNENSFFANFMSDVEVLFVTNVSAESPILYATLYQKLLHVRKRSISTKSWLIIVIIKPINTNKIYLNIESLYEIENLLSERNSRISADRI